MYQIAAKKLAEKAIKKIGKEYAEKVSIQSLKVDGENFSVNKLNKISEMDSGKYNLSTSPKGIFCERPSSRLIFDVSNRMKKEGITSNAWETADKNGRKMLIEKSVKCISQEMLIPFEKRADLAVEYTDTPDLTEDNSSVVFDEQILNCKDASEVYSKVFEKVSALDDKNKGISFRPLNWLFKKFCKVDEYTYNFDASSTAINESVIAEMEDSPVFADFHDGYNEFADNSLSVEQAKLKLEEISSWIKEINPKFNPFSPYGSNCGTCSYYVHERINGNNLGEAGPVNIAPTDPKMEALTGLNCQYMSVADIESVLRSRGPGSHLIVGINREYSAGHWFNAYYDGERFYTIDGQSGKIMDWPHDYGNVTAWCALV